MKHSKDYTILALAIPIAIVALFNLGLSCEIKKDKKIAAPKECPFECLECPNAKYHARDYQLELLADSTRIWQGDRLVNTIHYSASTDSVIYLDNE